MSKGELKAFAHHYMKMDTVWTTEDPIMDPARDDGFANPHEGEGDNSLEVQLASMKCNSLGQANIQDTPADRIIQYASCGTYHAANPNEGEGDEPPPTLLHPGDGDADPSSEEDSR